MGGSCARFEWKHRGTMILPRGAASVIWRSSMNAGDAHVNPWIYLVAAGVCEMGFTTFMKLSDGFQHWRYNVAFGVCALLSFGRVAEEGFTEGSCRFESCRGFRLLSGMG